MSLLISGTALDTSGVHGGPLLCQANPDGSPNRNQCYQPSSANSLNITRGSSVFATISVNPTSLSIYENSTGQVTVTNSANSMVAAENINATIPTGSMISVQSTTCGSSLAIGDSCSITFSSGTQEGPTSIPVSGSNTNTVTVDVTVTARPSISITSPVQQSRIIPVSGSALSLQITNDVSSVVNADTITVSDKTGCLDLSVDDSNCLSVAPGASCQLELTSPTPYAPCTITVSGSNTANSPTTLIAYSYINNLVFEASAGNGKVVIDAAQEFQSRWTNTGGNVGLATSTTDGVGNTDIIVGSSFCTSSPGNCAAQLCRNIGATWYLPASGELSTINSTLCSNQTSPCNFGTFSQPSYWSSTQVTNISARVVAFPLGTLSSVLKTTTVAVRCTQKFTY